MGRIYRRATARRDLVEHFVYLAETAGQNTADRFLESTRASFEDLQVWPSIGAPVTLGSPALAGMGKWPVRDFRNSLIFYLPRGKPWSVLCPRHLCELKRWLESLFSQRRSRVEAPGRRGA